MFEKGRKYLLYHISLKSTNMLNKLNALHKLLYKHKGNIHIKKPSNIKHFTNKYYT